MNQRVHGIAMVGRVSLVRILKLGLGGAIGGLITFIVWHPVVSGKALFGGGGADQGWVTSGMALGAVIGLTIGASPIAAEEWQTHSANRILKRSLAGAAAGALCGVLGGLDGQFMFVFVQSASVVLARCVGWALMGAGAGICPGLVGRSWKRAELGAFGGLVGGAAGGMLFDLLALAARGAGLSTALGLMLVGAAIGISVGLIEEMAKEYWLTVLTGPREGQSYVLSKNETTIGRDETVDIPLFGDSLVQRAHARVVKSDSGAYIRALQPGWTFTVNSQAVTDAPLSDGDIIGIGKHRLRFSARRATQAVTIVMASPQQQTAPANATSVQVVSGPHSGATFPLSAASILIGRSPECGISLNSDGSVSRQHARLVWDGASWRVEDCGSTNGVYVNGQRVSAQPIRPGDQIAVGQSVLRAI